MRMQRLVLNSRTLLPDCTMSHVIKHYSSNFRLLWPCITNVGWRERKTKLIWCLLSNFYLNMRPSSTQPQPTQPVQNITCSSTRSCSMMSIIMSETCWDRCWIINIRLVASCWFLSLFTLQYSSLVFLYWGRVMIIIVVAVVTAKCLCELRQRIIKQWRYRHSGMLCHSTGK